MRLKKLALLGALLALVTAFFILDLGEYLSLATLKARQAEIADFRNASPWLAAGAYFVIYVLVTALSLPGAALLTLAGGAVFGLLWGLADRLLCLDHRRHAGLPERTLFAPRLGGEPLRAAPENHR